MFHFVFVPSQAYEALVQKEGTEGALPGLGLTEEQLFFVGFARVCTPQLNSLRTITTELSWGIESCYNFFYHKIKISLWATPQIKLAATDLRGGSCSGEIARLRPQRSGFDSRTWRHIWNQLLFIDGSCPFPKFCSHSLVVLATHEQKLQIPNASQGKPFFFNQARKHAPNKRMFLYSF